MSCKHDLAKIYGIKGYPECSGHGICVQGLCVCDAGWTGHSDLERLRGFDCDINIFGMKFLSTFDLVLGAIGVIVVSSIAYNERILSPKNRFRTKSQIIMFYLLADICGCFWYGIKLTDPEKLIIGESIPLSILTVLITFFILMGAANNFINYVKFMKGYSRLFNLETSKSIQDLLYNLQYFSRVVPLITLACLIASTIAVILSPPSYSDRISIFYICSFLFTYLYVAVSLITVLNIFIFELKSYLDKNNPALNHKDQESEHRSSISGLSQWTEIFQLYTRMRRARYFMTPSLLAGVPLNILFASWIYIRRKQTYLLNIEFALAVVSSMGVTWSLSSSQNTAHPITTVTVSAGTRRSSVNLVRVEPEAKV